MNNESSAIEYLIKVGLYPIGSVVLYKDRVCTISDVEVNEYSLEYGLLEVGAWFNKSELKLISLPTEETLNALFNELSIEEDDNTTLEKEYDE